jgi:3-deoxy-7-phosphoheptulonate synthase
MPSYRGDIINGIEFTKRRASRSRQRRCMAYRQSAATLNLLRAFATGGYAESSPNVHSWMLGFVKDSPQGRALPRSWPTASPRRWTSCAPAASPRTPRRAARDRFYTSHEALLLGYEQALTRVDSTTGDWYATSGHMIWIGDRTRQPDGAHVEFCRGIKNPIGLKCGPSLTHGRPD